VIKTMSLLTRKEGMSVEDFQTYWRDVHGPMAAKMPGLRRYIQSHTLPETYGGDTPPDYDGIAELWWDSLEAYERSRSAPEAQATAADGRNFIESNIRLFVTEQPLVDALPSPHDRQSMMKIIGMLMVKDGVPIDVFQKHWREVHGPLNVRTIAGMRRYVQAHVLPERFDKDNPLHFGGLPEHWYDSLEAWQQRPRDPNAPRDLEWPKYCKGQKQIMAREIVIVA
jgi:uncharacterized protein (TIGR02118 family)